MRIELDKHTQQTCAYVREQVGVTRVLLIAVHITDAGRTEWEAYNPTTGLTVRYRNVYPTQMACELLA